MNLNDDVVYRYLRLGPLHQRHPGRSRGLICHHNRFHLDTSLYSLRLHGTSVWKLLAPPKLGVLPRQMNWRRGAATAPVIRLLITIWNVTNALTSPLSNCY
jgi:hypothetical protein